MEHSQILSQLKAKIITLAGDLPRIPNKILVQVLAEKDPSSPREELLLNQRILVIFFAAALLCEKLGVPLKDKVEDIAKELRTTGATHSISLLMMASRVLQECPADVKIDTILKEFAPYINDILSNPQLIGQDLLGKLYQECLPRSLAKPLNMNFTRWESAVLLAGCAFSLSNSNWGFFEKSSTSNQNFTIIDPACGTGSLLLPSNFFFREGLPRFIGLDVVPMAIHLLIASWNLLVDPPIIPRGIFQVLPLGNGRLGSLELLDPSSPTYDIPGMRQPMQLVIMNPPFSRSSGSNTSFGTLPAAEQQILGQRLKDFRKTLSYGNVGAAGQAADFILLAHRLLEPGGRLTAVLPISCLFGAAWTPVRRLLSEHYHIEVIFTHPEAGQCNFSDNTHLSECMLLARKHSPFQPEDSTTLVTQIRHLSAEEGRLSEITKQIVDVYVQQDPVIVLERDDLVIFAIKPANLSRFSWSWGPLFRFTSPKLNTFILQTYEWRTLFFPAVESCAIKLRPLETLGMVAHDRAAYRAMNPKSKSKIEGNYNIEAYPKGSPMLGNDSLPAFWGRQNVTLTRWIVHPNAILVRRLKLTPEQFARHIASRAQCLLPETLRFNTSSLFALYCPEGVVSNVFWGFLPHPDLKTVDGSPITTTEMAKVVTLWTNTTFGLLLFLAIADETDENLLHWKKQTLAHALLPDPESLSRKQIILLSALFDRFAEENFHKTIQMRISDNDNLFLDSEFFRICLDPANWEQYKSSIACNIKMLYKLNKNLFYIAF